MPVPKFKTSKSKRDMRRSHHALTPVGMSICANCNEMKLPHSVCESCGFYRGKQRIEPRSSMGNQEPNFNIEA